MPTPREAILTTLHAHRRCLPPYSASRDASFAALATDVGMVLSTDRTLGGLCDWIEAEAPRPVDLAIEGAATLKAAAIPVVLHYATIDPLR